MKRNETLPIQWSSFLRTIYHYRLEETIDKVRIHGSAWDQTQFELVQGALQDLKAKLQGKSYAGHIQQGRLYRVAVGEGAPRRTCILQTIKGAI